MFKDYNISVGNYTLKLKYNGGERLSILRAELWLGDLEINDCGWPTYIYTQITDDEASIIATKVSEGLRIKPPHQVMQEIGLLRKEDCRPPNTILFIKEDL